MRRGSGCRGGVDKGVADDVFYCNRAIFKVVILSLSKKKLRASFIIFKSP